MNPLFAAILLVGTVLLIGHSVLSHIWNLLFAKYPRIVLRSRIYDKVGVFVDLFFLGLIIWVVAQR